MTYDVIVIGLGAAGSAALHRLALRGCRVLGIEQFEPGHDRGSSHGLTRIIRLGYFEHPSYVPLVRRAYDLWREIERASGIRLLTVTGIAEIGRPDSTLVRGTLQSAREHALPHEVLDARALTQRFPAFRLPDGFIGMVQPDAGYLEPEKAIAAQIGLAAASGAEVKWGTPVTAIEPRSGGVRIVTAQGAVEAGGAVVCAGAWLGQLMPELALPLRVTRQAVLWFEPHDRAPFRTPHFPVFMIESERGIHYGFPFRDGEGVKAALHHHEDEATDARTCNREVTPHDEALVRAGLEAFLPAANGTRLSARICLYTRTPDDDFILDRLPAHPQIVVASPCSGHGFKFAPAIGEILAGLALDGGTSHDISRFRLAR